MEYKEILLGGLPLSSTNTDCLALFPPEQENSFTIQKVLVGDTKGKLYCLIAKSPNVEVLWNVGLEAPIACICMGGAQGGPRDKAFVASGSFVYGVNKKGKVFFTFDTNMTEKIGRVYVESNNLYVLAGHIYAHYVEAAEKTYYICPGVINDMTVINIKDSEETRTILGCQDRCIRVLAEGKVLFEISLDAIPTVLLTPQSDSSKFIYGTHNGIVSQISVSATASATTDWSSVKHRDNRSVKLLKSSADGSLYIVRDNGSVEICTITAGRLETSGSSFGSEVVTGLAAGNVIASANTTSNNTAEKPSVIITTFSGRLCLLENRISLKAVDLEEQINALRKEKETIERELTTAKEKLKKAPKPSPQAYLPMPKFTLTDNLSYDGSDMSNVLTVSADVPISSLALHAPFAIEVYPNSDVMVLGDGSSKDKPIRVIMNCNEQLRAELKIYPVEGQNGVISASIQLKTTPIISLQRQYLIKPLASYKRTSSRQNNTVEMNTLKLSGNFTVAEMNAWTSVCLPEVPEKTASTSAVEYFYYSPFIDTEIICTIKKGMAEFQSDSLTSLMILQEAVCREATARMRQVATDTAINMKAMQALLSKLHAKLKYQQNLGQSVKLLEAISELQTQEPDLSFLSHELAELWENREKIEIDMANRSRVLERLTGYFVNTFVYYHAASGRDVKDSAAELVKLINSGSHQPEEINKFILSQ